MRNLLENILDFFVDHPVYFHLSIFVASAIIGAAVNLAFLHFHIT